MSAAGTIVRFAAWTLPRRIRDRYREQWLADLRDADEAGVRPSEIAIGSLAFAATLARPIGGGRRPNTEAVGRRSRLAIGLSLSAALLALSVFATIVGGGGTWGDTDFFIAGWELSKLLLVYAVVAVTLSALLVTATRGTQPRVRQAVWLYIAASLAPLAQVVVDASLAPDYVFYRNGAWAYAVGALLVVVATLVLWRRAPKRVDAPTSSRARRVVASGVGAFLLLATVATGIGMATAWWAERTPLVYGSNADPAGYAQWLAIREWGDRLVLDVFVGWTAFGLIAALIIVAAGFAARGTLLRVIALALAHSCAALIVNGGVLTFLWLMLPTGERPWIGDLLLVFGRWGLVAVVLIAVGGLDFWRWRLTRREPDLAVA